MAESKALARVPMRRSLQPAATIAPGEMVKWLDRQGTELALNVPLVRTLFKSRNPFTDAEIMVFIQQARAKRANPFVGDLYLVKYAADAPAQMVTGYHYLIQAAKNNPEYAGFETWFVDLQGKRIADGTETTENVVACVCLVHIRGYEQPVKFVARIKEFKKNFPGTPWAGMPLVMLQKCAVGNAHRLADPGLAGMYLPEEFGQEYVAPPEAAVDVDFTEQPEAPQPAESDTPDATPSEEPNASPGGAEDAGLPTERAPLLNLMEVEHKKIGRPRPEILADWASSVKRTPEPKGPTDLNVEELQAYVRWLRAQGVLDEGGAA
jgi:hypothetical protein